eukprot:s418_g24.t1
MSCAIYLVCFDARIEEETASRPAQLSLDRDCSLSFLSNTTVNLSKEELPLGVVHEAFLPLAEWSTLVERPGPRKIVPQQGG